MTRAAGGGQRVLPACSCLCGPGATRGSPAPSEAKPWCSKLVGTKGEGGTEKSVVKAQQPRRCECSTAVVPREEAIWGSMGYFPVDCAL